jgi:spoIIIJ-associated protein
MENIGLENIKDKIAETIRLIVGFMDLECRVDIKEETDDKSVKSIVVEIHTPDNARFLIGKNGQNLRSLEQILRAIFLKKMPEINNIVVDVNDYKRSRTDYLVELARQAVTRVRSTQKAEALTPMTGYERRVVHMELASYPDIATESIGAEPNRRIVIKPYP